MDTKATLTCPICHEEGEIVPLYIESRENAGVTLTMKQKYRIRSADVMALCQTCSSNLGRRRWLAMAVVMLPTWFFVLMGIMTNSKWGLIFGGFFALQAFRRLEYTWADQLIYGTYLEIVLRDHLGPFEPEKADILFPVGFLQFLLRMGFMAASTLAVVVGASMIGAFLNSGEGAGVDIPEQPSQQESLPDDPYRAGCFLIEKNRNRELGPLLKAHPELKKATGDVIGLTLMHRAAMADNPEAIKELASAGCPLDFPDTKDSYTPLHWAALSGKNQALEALLKAGAQPNIHSGVGHTPLHLAALYGQKKTCEILLHYRADINARTSTGKTPLAFARMKNFAEIVRLLEAAQASD